MKIKKTIMILCAAVTLPIFPVYADPAEEVEEVEEKVHPADFFVFFSGQGEDTKKLTEIKQGVIDSCSIITKNLGTKYQQQEVADNVASIRNNCNTVRKALAKWSVTNCEIHASNWKEFENYLNNFKVRAKEAATAIYKQNTNLMVKRRDKRYYDENTASVAYKAIEKTAANLQVMLNAISDDKGGFRELSEEK